MNKLTIYYAHPLSLYGTPQEARDVDMLRQIGFEVYNPNSKKDDEQYANLSMEYFLRIIEEQCNLLAFRAFPDGNIPSGVAREIRHARILHMPILELPNGIIRRELTIEESREYLNNLGQR
jgi:hypothetical protein